MPELPEVETIRTQLSDSLPYKIKNVTYSKFHKSILKNKSFSPKGKVISEIKRKGKMLNFCLEGGNHILSHLGMSGSWQISRSKIEAKHTHIQLSCIDNSSNPIFLGYVDPRRFGTMYFLKQVEAEEKIATLGVDVSTKDFTGKYAFSIFQKRANVPIKALLLEQKYFAGIGNYIASEICALSKILPTRLARDITKTEADRIPKACFKVINQSIKSKGMTFHGGYVDATGSKGEGLKNLVVFYQKNCGMCKGEVTKIELKGRGTYFCPNCQK